MWLYVPKHLLPTSPHSQGSVRLISPSDACFQELSASSTWRGKSRLWRLWRLAWSRASWMPHLFGETFARSQETHSEAVLTWWQEAFPVRTSALQGREPASGASGLDSSSTSCAWFATFDHATSSWKTSQQSLFEDSTLYSDRWPKAGSMRNGAVSKRPTLARLMAGIGGGFSRGTVNWPTPVGEDSESAARTTTQGRPGWKSGGTLLDVARQWQTPSVADTMGGHLSRGGKRSGELLLRGQVKQWATPTTRDWKDGACSDADVPTNALLGRQAVRAEVFQDSRPAPKTEADGLPILPGAQTSRLQLNERFVEALMGLRTGWTDFAASGTPSCLSKPKPPCVPSGSAPSTSGRNEAAS